MKKKYILIALFLLTVGIIAYYWAYQYRNNGSIELELIETMEYHNDNNDFRPTRVISKKLDIYWFLYEISRSYMPDDSGKNIYSLARERFESDTTSNNADLNNLLKEASFPDSLTKIFIQSLDLKEHDYIVGFNRILKCYYTIKHTEQEWIPNDDRIPLDMTYLPETEDTLYIYRIKAPKGKFR